MLGITAFGMFHTILSLIGLAAGAVSLFRHGGIALASRAGQAFVLFTVASCVSGLFIHHHGGFGKPHVLSIVTLAVLAVAILAERRAAFGRASRLVSTLSYSLAFFFHFIPGFTETLTRVPVGHPWATGPEDPKLAALIGSAFVVFLIGATLQVLRLRSAAHAPV